MKPIFSLFIGLGLLFANPVFCQESDNPGEDFDLEALPGLFEEAESFEKLEEVINDSKTEINNLDLNGDGEVDYIMLEEKVDGDAHVLFLRALLADDDYQDIATIELEKTSASKASMQIVGDEDLYGKDYIIEPEDGMVDISDGASKSSGGKGGPSVNYPGPEGRNLVIFVRVFRPGYRVFVSTVRFRRYPVWFRPWRPVARSSFRARSARWHRSAFRRTSYRRSARARNMHTKHRKTSSKYHHTYKKSNTTKAKSTSNQNKAKASSNQNKAKTSSQQNKAKASSNQKKGGSPSNQKRRR